MLVTSPPPIITAFDQVQHTAGIRSGSIVIDRPEVALVVEGQFLGIAQASAENLEHTAVGLAAEHSATVWKVDASSFAIGQACSPVAKAHVDAPVGSLD